LNRNKSTTSPAWLSTEFKANWLREFVQPNIVPATLNYYQAAMRGASAADEAIITDADRKLKVPVLAVGAGRDMISPPEVQKATFDKWVEREGGVEQVVVDAGHWIALEKGEELASILVDFARRE
jgi:soluble epoxide hydrolase/lipid-phosphate phosphatase